MPVAFSNSGAYLISASVSGPATARTRTTFGVGALFDVLLLAHPPTTKAIAGSSASIRAVLTDLTANSSCVYALRSPPCPHPALLLRGGRILSTGQPQVLEIIALPPRLDSA